MATRSANPYIRRRDNPEKRVHVWQVRLQLAEPPASKTFSDKTWGGTAQALEAARQWRDNHPWYQANFKKPNEADEVKRYETSLLMDGEAQPRHCAFWRASWKDEYGRTWTRNFSVNFWGEEVARQKAQAINDLNLAQSLTSPQMQQKPQKPQKQSGKPRK